MTTLARALLALGLVALPGCATTPPPDDPSSIATAARPTFLEELERSPQTFVAEVGRARGLPISRPVPLRLDDDATFAKAFANLVAKVGGVTGAGATRGFYVAFHFAGDEPAGAPRSSTPDEVIDEQLVGFYDDLERVVHVRRSKLAHPGKRSDLDQRFIIGHEIEHALVHQRFGDQLPRGETDDDVRLAKKALVEGDASFAAVLAMAARVERSPRRALARISEYLTGGRADELASGKESSALRSAPANERERLLFPYNDGLAFVAAIYRSGGTALVDRLFDAPPTTTEQVLHPEKFLAGEGAIAVTAPAAPPGSTWSLSGQMGELMTSVVLARCLERSAARQTAVGWGGDAFTIVQGPEKHLAVLWSTAWDDAAAATRFASAVRDHADCLGAPNALGELTIGPGVAVAQDGNRVGVVLGVATAAADDDAKRMLTLVGKTPDAKPPLGDHALVPVKPRPTAAHGHVDGGSWTDEMLGIRVPIWKGAKLKAPEGKDQLSMSFPSPRFTVVSVELSDTLASPEGNRRIFAEFERGLRSGAKGVTFQRAWEGATEIGLGRGVGRQWRVPGTRFAATLTIVPICNGSGSYVVASAWSDENTRKAVARWVEALRPTTDGDPPICADLDP